MLAPATSDVGQFPAAHARQADIGQQQVDGFVVLQAFEGALDVGRLGATIAGIHQHFGDEHAHRRRVLDDQHMFTAALGGHRRRFDGGGGRVGARRQHDGDFGAASRHAADVRIAP
ncbi:hypothetical protein D3C76_935790 [compost metagenome]